MSPPSLNNVLVSVDDTIAVISYNRPKNANALNGATMSDLLTAFTWATSSPAVRVIIYTGEGKFFSSGMDLVDTPDSGPVLPDPGIARLEQMHKVLINTNKVLIAAVNGPAVGYGTSSIALFDLVYSVPDAYFFCPFVKWGLCAEACASVSFTRIMGRQKASALILAGERMTAQELEAAGLVTKILPKENFIQEVMAAAKRIAKQPPGALAFNKSLMMAPIRDELLAANERECEGLRQRGRTDEPREAIKAFEEEKKARRAKL
jgi:Delta3-Delta2-enoyl-CoA isomerase